jgi:polyisoprenoid-binding protein YceI
VAIATSLFHGTYEIDAAHSSFEAGVRHMGVGSFRTRFDEVEARLISDGDGLRLEGAARVDSIAIKAPPEFRDHVVNGSDFFDARRHPQISFRTVRIEIAEDGSLEVDGELTIKGITRPVHASGSYRPPVEDPYGDVRTAIDLTATVDRRDFGMDWQAALPKGGDVLGWEVTVDIRAEFVQAPSGA